MVAEGQLLWTPSADFADGSNIAAHMHWLKSERGLDFADYAALWAWSVEDLPGFWKSIWDYFEIHSPSPIETVLSSLEMPGAEWFRGATVNYAEHVLRHENSGDSSRPFLYHCSEIRDYASVSWQEVGSKVRILAQQLRAMGIGAGDRVVAYMPNIPEAVIAMLATTAIGAVWSAAAPEFGTQTVVDRFGQIAPKLLFAADGYRYAGKDFDRRTQIREIVQSVPSIEKIVWFNYLNEDAPPADLGAEIVHLGDLLDSPPIDPADFRYEYVDGRHPLWILFSSGTTGLPKPIVHGHIGILLEHYKSAAFHLNLKPGRTMYFYSTTGWMMWNTLMWAPLMNAAAVLYDGHPAHPEPDFLWKLAEKANVQSFGTSPTFIDNTRKLGIVPKEKYHLPGLENIFLVGSPATPETFAWLYETLDEDLWVTSQSGGTEFCSGLVGGSPTLPVYAGEIQARTLGADIKSFDQDGREIIGEAGELVITKPMPSMPLFLWGDEDFKRYREAYFDHFPGVWRHGDSLTINARGGCHLHGRSDATLNRFGVRIGSAEIYRTLDGVAEITDSVIVCVETKDGGYYMPLFVALAPGITLDADLTRAINTRLRRERSPRHVPDEIIAVPTIPYTLTNKKMEVPIRKLLLGESIEKAVSQGAMRDPSAILWFAEFAERYLGKS
ncbi:acetoacetate--CoA ligase [Rhizobium skierniewicense]|uniref:acetoacetate--CoA ligase n=1 Tax=Rhizobium skierniewicense TaxID=984260 RepID=UPI001FAC2BD9|nr:acetoacetate--CoA ligase [Rhizobium skierniewicense]MCI9867318.1 acetoacetate--CoA ligase [Rhizobium skierniewicense]